MTSWLPFLVLALTAPPAPDFDAVVGALEARRSDLARRYRRVAPGERAAVRDRARAEVVRTIVEEIFPAWMGTPWGLGRDSDAARPHQSGKVVGCSYFVTAVLENAGLVLESRRRFAQAPALWIERALLPSGATVHRFGSLPAPELRRRLLALGPGLYLVGLDVHVGFLVVGAGDVRVIHASYTTPRVVVDEPLATSAVIANSRPRGYHVSPLFRDDRLVELWLQRMSVPAPPRWPVRR